MEPQKIIKGLQGLHKPFWGTTKKRENKHLGYFLSSDGINTGSVEDLVQNLWITFQMHWSLFQKFSRHFEMPRKCCEETRKTRLDSILPAQMY